MAGLAPASPSRFQVWRGAMTAEENPAPLGAGRAPNSFCLAAEHSEDSLVHIEVQDRNVAIGVDTGLSGAVAILDANSGLIVIHDMPCLDGVGAAGRRPISAPLLADIVLAFWPQRGFP